MTIPSTLETNTVCPQSSSLVFLVLGLFIIPSTLTNVPVPAEEKQPQSMMLPRQRGRPETNKTREVDRGQIAFVSSVEGMVTLELAFSATLDVVPSPLFRACCHSLSRLKDA